MSAIVGPVCVFQPCHLGAGTLEICGASNRCTASCTLPVRPVEEASLGFHGGGVPGGVPADGTPWISSSNGGSSSNSA